MSTINTVIDLFNEQVRTLPDGIAVVFGNSNLTYKELDEKSNQLANYLIKRGVKSDTIIPICINRSKEMIIGILGIIKAGGAYVPIDPEYPVERKNYIINNASGQFSLSNKQSSANLASEVILLDDNWETISNEPNHGPAVILSPESLVYLIYTSGSTGEPKGVMIEHRSLLNYIEYQQHFFKFNGNERILQFSNFCFDASIEQIFLALTSGSTLILIPENTLVDIDRFSRLLIEEKITHLHATPGYLENIPHQSFPDLKRIIAAGDTCNIALAKKWVNSVDFYNKYGPTESTISVLEYRCPKNIDDKLKILPIGKPIANAKIYLLDENLNVVEDGSEGELYIAGIPLARGYYNKPEEAAKSFTIAPFNTSERIYRTGDLARKLENGDIEFLGRIDSQVKIRGYRIELGEIETILRTVSGVLQCVVSTDEHRNHLIAYLVTSIKLNRNHLRNHLLNKLPEYMVPQFFVEIDDIPLTKNGKIDKKLLPVPDASALLSNDYTPPKFDTEKKIAEIWKSLLQVKRVGTEDNFFELGGNSLLAQKMIVLLKENQIKLPITKLYQYPNVGKLAAFIDGRTTRKMPKQKQVLTQQSSSKDIAVIGMSGRFPGADTISEFWDNLKNGVESTYYFSNDELDADIPEPIRNNPNYVKARGLIKNPAAFDPEFFGINPKLAELMDPQQRIFLEICWEALEHSLHIPTKYEGTIGVYAGCRFNTYYTHNVISNKEMIENVGAFQVTTVSDKDYIASRTAYSLDLKGPAVNVQSGCSTSLLAIAQAVESIRNGYCDVALAGGSAMLVPVNSGHLYEEGAILSADGHCKPFDAEAKGTVFSDGAGVVVLKSRKQAELDGDTIFAVIKGIGLSNDGGAKGSFTAPSAEGQANAILMAVHNAGVNPADIGYIEAHGTATPIGDPIEIEGLNMAFGEQPLNQYCAIGSVKSNFGHLTGASGVVGLIKTTLALYHRQLPPSINFKTPNPLIDFKNSPFYVNTTLKKWETTKERIAGVSSFGVGGTNVHLILAEAKNDVIETTVPRPFQLIPWSAKTEKSLNLYGEKLAEYIQKNESINLADISFTLKTARENFKYRRFAVLGTGHKFDKNIINDLNNSRNTNCVTTKDKDIVFMFPGQGSQFVNMGKELFDLEPVFKSAMQDCARILEAELNENILHIIYPEKALEEAENKLRNTKYSQPALFSIGYALGKLFMNWGIFPAAFIGHSIGEFVSAYFAGIFTLSDALKLIAARGKMMSALEGGSMLSVRLTENEILPYLSIDVSLAAINSPKLCVVAGSDDSIRVLSDDLNEKGILNRVLQTSHAFHSHMMDEIIAPFEEVVNKIPLSKPLIPIVSTVTGNWLTDMEALDPKYWAKHLRATVLFGKAAQVLLDESYSLFLELGPGNATSTLTRQQAGKNAISAISVIEKTPESEDSSYSGTLRALGQLWINGIEPDWNSYYKGDKRRKINNIPTYAFNNKNYWVDPVRDGNPVTKNEIINAHQTENQSIIMRKQNLINQVKEILENASGIEMNDVKPDMTFIEIGLDSLLLTQIAIILKKQYSLPITFRQLNEEYGTLDLLTDYLDKNLPAYTPPQLVPQSQQLQQFQNPIPVSFPQVNGNGHVGNPAIDLISQQLQLLAAQLLLLQGNQQQVANNAISQHPPAQVLQSTEAEAQAPAPELTPEEEIEIRKPFGAAARIEKQSAALNEVQAKFLADLTYRYNEKTKGSKAYTQKHRARMADPRVVSGFKPATKELVYSIVINKSKGSRVWDIDGNEYIDALNGFGSNMLGYQPDFIKNALFEQIEKGYEIGPQHELAGEVSELICEFTKFDRAGLCNTGSEAVLGAMRIARTVTGRSIIVAFTGSYHGITDEVIVRGSKKLKTFPAAPGIMPEAVQNMLILDYGTDESLRIIEEGAHEIAAVLVEPVQSRRADFQPIEFLKKLRKITEDAETVLIFDEVISGFRFHPQGVQGLFGIQADLGTYGKVAGGGISIGIIAGKKKFMDALDGGFWQFGDASIPEAGVTYFAGTFVRHPLALAATKASLTYLKEMGPQLQENLNANGTYIANTLNEMCKRLRVPIYIAQFGSLWRIKFIEEYPYTELFFTLMRLKGIHVLEGFACFLTTAHSNADIQQIIKCFEESLTELKEVGLIPDYQHPDVPKDVNAINQPPVPNAKLGKDKEGNPAWFVKDNKNPGKYFQVN